MIALLSFVIPAYNEKKRIVRTIDSVKKSCEAHDIQYEIIVSDNLSTDETVSLAKKHDCIVVHQDVEPHIGRTRNTGASVATGEWIVFLDADSVVTPQLLEQALANVSTYICISAITRFHSYNNGRSYGVWFFNILAYMSAVGSGQFLVIRKDCFDELGGFDVEVFGYEDLDFFRRIKERYTKSAIHICWAGIYTSDRKFDGSHSLSRFLGDMMVYALGGTIGRDKARLGMRYDVGKKQKSTPGRQRVLLFLVACMFRLRYVEIVTGEMLTPQSPWTILAPFLLMSIPIIVEQKQRKTLLIVSVTFFLEYVGHETGFPFGIYTYLDPWSTQVGLFRVPLFVPLAWLVIVSSVSRVSRSWRQAVLGVICIDLLLEPFATQQGYWVWESGGALTAPIWNYIAWGVVGGLGYMLLRGEQKQTWIWSVMCLVVLMVYVGTMLLG